MCLKRDNMIGVTSKTSNSRWSIAAQLAWFYTLSTSVLLILALGFLYWILLNTLEKEDEIFLKNRIHALGTLLQKQTNNSEALNHEIFDENIELVSNQYKIYSRVLDQKGFIRYETVGMNDDIPTAAFSNFNEINTESHKWRNTKGNDFRLIAIQVDSNDVTKPKWQIQMALDGSGEEKLISEYARYLLSVLLIGIFASAVISIVATRHGLKPLFDITNAAERITASQLHERINAAQWPEELIALGRAFDSMLDRLEDSFNRLSQLSADLAHELRTPINNLRGEAEVALSKPREVMEYREILASSLEEYDRLTRMTDSLLFLAKADNGQMIVTTIALNMRNEIVKITEFYEALANEQDVKIICEGEGMLYADPILFQRAISNLLSNALHYTNTGGKITFSIHNVENVGIEIICCDTGMGIAQEHLPKVFDRFYRVSQSRNVQAEGAGLGLAIVKSIVNLHGGQINVHSTPGIGTSIKLTFPVTL